MSGAVGVAVATGTMLVLMTVFTIVDDAFRPNARPFKVTICTLPAVENETPAAAIMVPTMVPPPAALIVKKLKYPYNLLAKLTFSS